MGCVRGPEALGHQVRQQLDLFVNGDDIGARGIDSPHAGLHLERLPKEQTAKVPGEVSSDFEVVVVSVNRRTVFAEQLELDLGNVAGRRCRIIEVPCRQLEKRFAVLGEKRATGKGGSPRTASGVL